MQNRAVSPSLTLVVAIVLSIVLGACASATAESDEPAASDPAAPEPAASEPAASEAPSEDEPSAGQGAPEPPSSDMGSFTVNDTVFAVTQLNRCIPFTEAPENIDLQALAQGAQLNLTLSSDMVDVSVQGPAIEEAFGSIAFGESAAVHESAVTDDRWGGSATAGDSLGSGTAVDIAWDVTVPAEINNCSL